MLPCVLVLATFAQPVPTPYGVWGQFVGLPGHSGRGGPSSASPYSAVFLWGDPTFAQGVTLPPYSDLLDPLPLLEELKRRQPAPVTPPDPTAERIKVVEGLILELKARGGSAAAVEALQRHLDELRAPPKKPK